MVKVEEVDTTHLMKGTQTFGKKTEAIEENLEEGGASMTNKVGKQCHLFAITAAKPATTKKSAERRGESASTSQKLTNYAQIRRLWWIVRNET